MQPVNVILSLYTKVFRIQLNLKCLGGSVIPGMGEFVCLPSQGNSQCHLKNHMRDKRNEIQETANRRMSMAVSPRSSQQWRDQDTLIPSTHWERGRSGRFNLCCLHLPLPHVYNTDNIQGILKIYVYYNQDLLYLVL